MQNLDTPTIIIDLKTIRRNMERMIQGLAPYGIAHRPHFKAHKSLYLARLQIELGARGMTCATLGEAEVLANGCIDDIFIAYPIIGDIKLRRLTALCARAQVSSVINSLEGAAALSEAFAKEGMNARVLIELEGGMGRSPVTLENLPDFAEKIKRMPGLEVIGVMTYRGNVYGMADAAQRAREAAQEAQDLLAAKDILAGFGMDAQVLSGGSSFTSKTPELLPGLTEVRAGNYIFNDVAQLSMGLVSEADCALTVLARVVTLPAPGQAVIDAGSKTLTTELAAFGKGFGRVVGNPGTLIHKLSEEHGYLTLPEGMELRIGDLLRVIPNHACVVPNLADRMFVDDGGDGFFIDVDARGKNQ